MSVGQPAGLPAQRVRLHSSKRLKIHTSHIKTQSADPLKSPRTWHSGTHICGACQPPRVGELTAQTQLFGH